MPKAPDVGAPDVEAPDVEALARWAAGLAPRAGRTRVLGIDGRSGAGKSGLADRVARAARPPGGAAVPVVRLDDAYPGWDGLDAGIGRVLRDLLEPLAQGRPAGLRTWDWARGMDGPWLPVGPAELLVLEGVGAGALACAPYLAGLVWLDAPAPLRRARALARDGAVYAPHWRRWARQEAAYLARDHPRRRADLVLDGTGSLGAGSPPGPLASPGVSDPLSGTTAAGRSLVVRPVDPDTDEVHAWMANAALVFKDPVPSSPEGAEFRRPVYRRQRLSAAYDGGTLVGTFRSWDTTLTVPGGSVTTDAVSSVTVRPTHRRRGALRAMMTADLDRAAAAGTAAAILIASEGGIYGRFGFAPAARTATWRLDPARAVLRPQVRRAGTVEVVPVQSLRPHVEAVYAAARRPGAMDRDASWWDAACRVTVRPGDTPKPLTAVRHLDAAGRVDGYLTYHVELGWAERRPTTVVHVDELESATPGAYAALWGYLAELDLVAEVRAQWRPVDEHLPWLFTDHRAVRQESPGDFLWSRLLDPAAALSARRYETAGDIVLEVLDDAGGHAAGRFALASDGAAGVCGRTDRAPDVTLTVQALSQTWLGAPGLAGAAVAGAATEHTDGALLRLSSLLRTDRAPWTNTWF